MTYIRVISLQTEVAVSITSTHSPYLDTLFLHQLLASIIGGKSNGLP